MNLKTKIATLALGAMMAMGVGSAVTFKANNDMSGVAAAGETYSKASSISAGDKVVFVCEKAKKELTSISTTSTKYGIGTAYTNSVAASYVFDVVAGSETGTFSFKKGSNYLRWNSGNSLDADGTSAAKNTSWKVTFDGSSNALLKNANDSAREIWWNNGSPRFACYTGKSADSTYYAIQIYKQQASSKTLSSIEISGSMSKTDYYVGDNWNYTGLTATGTYSDGDFEDVTDKVTWSFNPENADNTSITSVEVIASIGDVESDPYEQNVTVSYGPAKTIEEALEMDQGKPYTITGVITNVKGNNFYMQDNTGAIYVYSNNISYINNATTGDKVRVSGSNKLYNGLIECVPAAIERITTGEPVQPVNIDTYEEYVATKQSSYVNVSGLTYSSGTIKSNDSENMTLKFNLGENEISVYFPSGLGDRAGVISALGDTTDPTARYSFSSVNIGWYNEPQIEVIRSGQIVRYTEIVALDYIEASAIDTFVDESASIEVEFSPSNATNKRVTFRSLDETVAIVDETGLVTGVAAGTTQIEIVPSDDNASTIYVDVTVSVAPSRVYQKVTSNLADYSGTYLIVYETSASEGRVFNFLDAANGFSVATINDCYIEHVAKYDKYSVIVSALGNDNYSIKINDAADNNAGRYLGGVSGSNSISFSTTSIDNTITVNNNGEAVIESNSTSFRYNSTSGQDRFRYYKTTTTGASYIYPSLYKLVVGEYPSVPDDVMPESIEINEGTSGTLFVGETKQLTATILPSNTTNKNVVWESSNDSVATVNESGVVTGVAVGSATITVSCEADSSINDTFAITVESQVTPSQSTWELVTDASTLKAGDVIVLASTANGATAGSKSGDFLSSVESTFEGNTITSLGTGTLEFVLAGQSGSWRLINDGECVGATAAKKLAIDSGTTTWSISISGNNATIQSTTSDYGRFLYNVNSPRFLNYTSNTSVSMLLPQIYRKVETEHEGSIYADLFLEELAGDSGACDAAGNTNASDLDTAWEVLEDTFADLSSSYKLVFKYAAANQNGTSIEKAAALYDYIVAKYSACDDFMSRDISASNTNALLRMKENSDTMLVVVVISMLSTVSIAAYLRLRKKKEN